MLLPSSEGSASSVEKPISVPSTFVQIYHSFKRAISGVSCTHFYILAKYRQCKPSIIMDWITKCVIDLKFVALINCCKRRRCDLDEDGNCMGDVMMSLSSSSIGWFHDVIVILIHWMIPWCHAEVADSSIGKIVPVRAATKSSSEIRYRPSWWWWLDDDQKIIKWWSKH